MGGDSAKVLPTTKKELRSIFDPTDKGTSLGGAIDPGGTIIKRTTGVGAAQELADPVGVVARQSPVEIAEAEAKKQRAAVSKQSAAERKRLAAANATLEAGAKKRRQGQGGRSLLIATSQTGLKETLGGA